MTKVQHVGNAKAVFNVKDLYSEGKKGNIEDSVFDLKFGHSDNITTSLAPVCEGEVYRTPTALTSLEMVSDNANDTASGSGGQQVYVEGIGANWLVQSELVELDGLNAVALANQYFRIYRMFVTRSGTYANASAGSHVGSISLRESGAGQLWARISNNGVFPLGQSEIACLTVPKGEGMLIHDIEIHVETAKTVDIYAFRRENADDVVSPYSGIMKVFLQLHGVTERVKYHPKAPFGVFMGAGDVGFMAKSSTGTAGVGIEFTTERFKI